VFVGTAAPTSREAVEADTLTVILDVDEVEHLDANEGVAPSVSFGN